MSAFQYGAGPAQTLPFMPLREVVMFPRSIMPLFVGREASIKAIEEGAGEIRQIHFPGLPEGSGGGAPRRGTTSTPWAWSARCCRCCACRDGTIKVLFEGMNRAVWRSLLDSASCPLVQVEDLPETESRPEEREALVRAVHESLEEYAKGNKKISQEAVLAILAQRDPGALADAVLAAPQGGITAASRKRWN